LKSTQTAFEAWRSYLSAGRIHSQLLRGPVYRAWERAHVGGANPRRIRAEMYSRIETERLREANETLIGAAQPYMRALARAAGSEMHAVVLGEATGVVIDARGHDQLTVGPHGVASPGSMLSEAHAGANGIATPVAEGRYVELVGPEHFIGGFHDFTCQGLPVRGVDGETIGSLCITVPTGATPSRFRSMAKIAGRGIEAELVVSRLRARLRELPVRDDWTHLERLHQDIVQIHAMSRLEFDLAAFELSRSGDATTLLRRTRDLLERFARLSRLWQVLADPVTEVVVEVDADQLVRDSVDLMQTEARMQAIDLRVATQPCGRVPLVHEVVRALVHGHAVALRGAGQEGSVEVAMDERGRVGWTVVPAVGRPSSLHCDLPVVYQPARRSPRGSRKRQAARSIVIGPAGRR
jgi:transcriptional regulator of acetoin/glycerol metabolism